MSNKYRGQKWTTINVSLSQAELEVLKETMKIVQDIVDTGITGADKVMFKQHSMILIKKIEQAHWFLKLHNSKVDQQRKEV